MAGVPTRRASLRTYAAARQRLTSGRHWLSRPFRFNRSRIGHFRTDQIDHRAIPKMSLFDALLEKDRRELCVIGRPVGAVRRPSRSGQAASHRVVVAARRRRFRPRRLHACHQRIWRSPGVAGSTRAAAAGWQGPG